MRKLLSAIETVAAIFLLAIALLIAGNVLLRNVAVGVGIVGVVSLTAGVARLATRKRVERTVAVQPYGGRLGAGATFRVRF